MCACACACAGSCSRSRSIRSTFKAARSFSLLYSRMSHDYCITATYVSSYCYIDASSYCYICEHAVLLRMRARSRPLFSCVTQTHTKTNLLLLYCIPALACNILYIYQHEYWITGLAYACIIIFVCVCQHYYCIALLAYSPPPLFPYAP